MNQLAGKWTVFQIEAEHEHFGLDRLVDSHNALVKQRDNLQLRVDALERFLVDLQNNWDCDSDAHKYGTPCRGCCAAELMERQ